MKPLCHLNLTSMLILLSITQPFLMGPKAKICGDDKVKTLAPGQLLIVYFIKRSADDQLFVVGDDRMKRKMSMCTMCLG